MTVGGNSETEEQFMYVFVQPPMDVMGSCGYRLGVVAAVEGDRVLVKETSTGKLHSIPLSWVQRVDRDAHLDRSCVAARLEWQEAPEAVGA
jgi:hypothetical protein